ncbi:MAG: hypothetical protein WB588_03075 [Dehalococcoidia bacterium]
MEINFILLVIAALFGLIINAIWGFNPWAIFGGISFLVMIFPILGLGFEHDPQVVQTMANVIIQRLLDSLPSLMIGELAGILASRIFRVIRGLFN